MPDGFHDVVSVCEQANLIHHDFVDELESVVPHRHVVSTVGVVPELCEEDWYAVALHKNDVGLTGNQSCSPDSAHLCATKSISCQTIVPVFDEPDNLTVQFPSVEVPLVQCFHQRIVAGPHYVGRSSIASHIQVGRISCVRIMVVDEIVLRMKPLRILN